MTCKLKIAGTVNDSVVDGPGIRFVIFTQGCLHNCKGCQNPETHDLSGGHETDIETLFKAIKKNPLLTGVTYSGGEPFLQAEPLIELGKKIKEQGLELSVYTGFTFEELINTNDEKVMSLLNITDILIDGRYIAEEKTMNKKFKGSLNQRIIDVKKSLESGCAAIDISDRWN